LYRAIALPYDEVINNIHAAAQRYKSHEIYSAKVFNLVDAVLRLVEVALEDPQLGSYITAISN
jgi:hypothetical protein